MILAHDSALGHLLPWWAAVAAIGWYLQGWLRGSRRRPRLVAFVAGVLVLLAATSQPVEVAAGRSFTAHMAQHLALWVVGPPLIVSAHPARQAITRSKPDSWWRRAAAVVDGVPRRGWYPTVAATAMVVVAGSHAVAVYDSALTSQLVHDAEHLAYLTVSLALWSVLLGPSRSLHSLRIGITIGVMASMVVLGLVLAGVSRPLYPTYVERSGSAEALADQRSAASLMWIGSMLVMTPALIGAVWRWASAEHRHQLLAERSERSERSERRSAIPPRPR
ncbi:MAG: cytochrome c oxidase assembly protein [Acidimicrobiales bacterium]